MWSPCNTPYVTASNLGASMMKPQVFMCSGAVYTILLLRLHAYVCVYIPCLLECLMSGFMLKILCTPKLVTNPVRTLCETGCILPACPW